MKRGRKKKKEKKGRKNVYLKENQINYILKRCGGDGNFSPYLSKIIDLYISLSDALIVQELTPEAINDLKNEILDEYNRKTWTQNKVMEYKEVYEDLTRYGRYIIPNVKNVGSASIRLIEFLLKFDYDKLDENKINVLEKLVRYNNILEEMKVDYRKMTIDLTGRYPYSLLWYSKFLVLMVSQLRNSWELVKTVPEELIPAENLRTIRIYFKKGESAEKSKEKAIEYFNDTRLKIKDLDNHGIWNLLNNQSYSIMDNQYLINYNKEDTEKMVPYQGVLEQFKSENKFQNVVMMLKMYEKIHLIANLSVTKRKIIFNITNDMVEKMIKDTFNYLEIAFKLSKKGVNIVLEILEK